MRAVTQKDKINLLARYRARESFPFYVPADLSRQKLDVRLLPFAANDATAGTENELQAIVIGTRNAVDLPVTIERSRYYANIARRVACGEASRDLMRELRDFLTDNREQVWENSWVRFPRKYLSHFASQMLDMDLGITPVPGQSTRSDRDKILFAANWGEWVRVPVSYLVKLALADVIGQQPELPQCLKLTAHRLLPGFLNDLTSPETLSFYLIDSRKSPQFGRAVATEMSQRFLLTHLLVEWANKAINLEAIGQRAGVNFAPHPPVRQRALNNCVSDAFYRELFVSPCLSGWSDGEVKHEYMRWAHEVTSRSQINAVVKLREAGIVTNNLVVLPNTSSVSLANNGTHLSLGSKRLGQYLTDLDSGFTMSDEKRLGDLVIKIAEHFLPPFVGTYTAAPYRLHFADFHPEKALGFLPHELDYTHLRMLWRHWKKKARLGIFGNPLTPLGPPWLDNSLARLFGLRGDLVADYRLIDFPIAWLCTDSTSALDGHDGNIDRLKNDLESMGVTDHRLKLYLPIALRAFHRSGFSGFEGRHYSLCDSLLADFAPAADLQRLITVLAYKYALSGTYTHRNIPDDPSSESERRLPFFYMALRLPAFNVRTHSPNDFLRRVVAMTENATASRHRGYLRLTLHDYCLALVRVLQQDAQDCIEMLGLEETIADLIERLQDPNAQAYGKLLNGILGHAGKSKPFNLEAREFNLASEEFYRRDLKQRFLKEALELLRHNLENLAETQTPALRLILSCLSPGHFLREIEAAVLRDELTPEQLRVMISLVLLAIRSEMGDSDDFSQQSMINNAQPPIRRAVYAAGA